MRCKDLLNAGRVPLWVARLVNEQCADALHEIALAIDALMHLRAPHQAVFTHPLLQAPSCTAGATLLASNG